MVTPEQEKAALENEWKKMGGVGRDLQMKRLVATLAAIAVAVPFFGFGLVVLLGSVMGLSPVAFLIGGGSILAGMALGAVVRKWLWPTGQFA